MKRLINFIGGLIGLLAIGALLFALNNLFQTRASPSETVTPLVSAAVAPTVPPRCTFKMRSATSVPRATLEAYHFSEPRVALTHTLAIGIVEWLPNSEELLITRDIPGTNRQAIETFNVRRGETRVYAEREGSNGKPVWLSALKAVAYSTFVAQKHELWISWGDPQQATRLAQDVEGLSLTVAPDGRYLTYFSSLASRQPQRLDVAARVMQAMPLDLARWEYPRYPKDVQSLFTPSVFRIAWHPDSSQIVFYTQPWTFLYNMTTNQVCEMNLGQFSAPIWALEAKWSPNGRYLALITTDNSPRQASGTGIPILSTDLTILDIETGSLRRLQPAPDIEGRRYVTDMAWAPDSHHLAALGVVQIDQRGSEKEGLFIVDTPTGKIQRLASDYDWGGGLWGWQIAWSSDGSQLAVNCPTSQEGKLCVITLRPKSAREEQP